MQHRCDAKVNAATRARLRRGVVEFLEGLVRPDLNIVVILMMYPDLYGIYCVPTTR